MKRLSVALLLLGLTGCNYPSMTQADEACDKWKENSETVTYTRNITVEEEQRERDRIQAKYYKYNDLPEPYSSLVIKDFEPGMGSEAYERLKTKVSNAFGKDLANMKKMVEESKTTRWCSLEEETNQYLGYERKLDDNGKELSREIAKHFRY